MLDRLRTWDEIPEALDPPDDWIHDALIREFNPDISQAGIIRLWDERRNNETSWALRRSRLRCPRCTHRSWTKVLFTVDAVVCRWGHVVPRREVPPPPTG